MDLQSTDIYGAVAAQPPLVLSRDLVRAHPRSGSPV